MTRSTTHFWMSATAENMACCGPVGWIRPIRGSARCPDRLTDFRRQRFYCGSLDVLIADALRLRDRASAEGATNFTFALRKDLLHDWPIFPFLPDARADRPVIYRQLGLDRAATDR